MKKKMYRTFRVTFGTLDEGFVVAFFVATPVSSAKFAYSLLTFVRRSGLFHFFVFLAGAGRIVAVIARIRTR